MDRFKSMPGVQVIDVVAPVEQVIEQLTACRLVVSSSLHGLVVAESYGIPNAWITLSDEIIGGRYKFDDYYSAAGESRNPVELEQVVAEADDYIDGWRPIQGLSTLQARLLRAFPIRPVAEVMDRLSHPARTHR